MLGNAKTSIILAVDHVSFVSEEPRNDCEYACSGWQEARIPSGSLRNTYSFVCQGIVIRKLRTSVVVYTVGSQSP